MEKADRMKAGFLVMISTVILTLSSCNKVVGPHYATQPGPRDYTWQVDTINADGNILSSIDGSSDSSVWAVGEAGDFRFTIWHFDGKKWSTDSVNRPLSPNAVRAFSPTDVWAVGEDGQIWNYNGIDWSQQARVPLPKGAQGMFLNGIDGNSPSNLYADGEFFDSLDNAHPLIYHLSGSQWSQIKIQDFPDCGLYKMSFFASNRALVLGFKHLPDGSAPDSDKIFSFDGNNLQEIYSGIENRTGWADFCRIAGGCILLEGTSLSFYDGGQSQSLLMIASSNSGAGIVARSTDDVVLSMLDGIAQYNGSDLEYLYHFTGSKLYVTGMKMFSKSLFILTHDYSNGLNYVYRGYLPK